MVNLNVPHIPFNLPWFMLDLDNIQLITSTVIPGDISDTKNIVLTETPIPGKNYQPVQYGGGGNRKISFTLPLIKRNNTVGNVMIIKQFEMLRNQAVGLLGLFSKQFNPTPQVLYYYGTGSIPLPYYVSKCGLSHKKGWVNELGNPQYSEVELELILNEDSPLYVGEEVYRKIMAMMGMVTGIMDTVSAQVRHDKPY